jgi:hypothetical protein
MTPLYAQAQVEAAQTYFDKLTTWNEQLAGLPGGTFTALFVVVLCVFLKWVRWFPDNRIPGAALFLGVAMFFCLANPQGTMPLKFYIAKNMGLGFIVSVASMMAALKFGPRLPVIGKYISDDPPKPPPVAP